MIHRYDWSLFYTYLCLVLRLFKVNQYTGLSETVQTKDEISTVIKKFNSKQDFKTFQLILSSFNGNMYLNKVFIIF